MKQNFAEFSAILWKPSGELKQPFPLESIPTLSSAGLATRGAPAAALSLARAWGCGATGQLAGTEGTVASLLKAHHALLTLDVDAGAVLIGLQKHFSQIHLDNLVGFYFVLFFLPFFFLSSCPQT